MFVCVCVCGVHAPARVCVGGWACVVVYGWQNNKDG